MLDRDALDQALSDVQREMRHAETRLAKLKRAHASLTDLRLMADADQLAEQVDAMERPSTGDAILTILEEHPERLHTAQSLVAIMDNRDWLPESENPIGAVRAALQRLFQSDMIARPKHGHYQHLGDGGPRVTIGTDEELEGVLELKYGMTTHTVVNSEGEEVEVHLSNVFVTSDDDTTEVVRGLGTKPMATVAPTKVGRGMTQAPEALRKAGQVAAAGKPAVPRVLTAAEIAGGKDPFFVPADPEEV